MVAHTFTFACEEIYKVKSIILMSDIPQEKRDRFSAANHPL